MSTEGNLYEVSLKEKIDSSAFIVSGKVVAQSSYWDEKGHMIYTNNKILMNTVFKGILSQDTINITTVGGKVGNQMIKTSSLLELHIGDQGLFFLNKAKNKTNFKVYSSKQGFIHFFDTKAWCPFYESTVSELIQNINEATNNFKTSGYNSFGGSVLSLSSGSFHFSPSLITAGTNSYLTITGNGFGNTGPDSQNYVAFANADDGGAPSFIAPMTSSYALWSDTMIIVSVPTQAGTGPIKISVAGNTEISQNQLTIPYAILNTGADSIPQMINSNGTGGQTWHFNSNMNFSNGASGPFNRALDTWKCATGVNWTVSGNTTSIDDPVAGDGVNVVARNQVANGVLGVCYNYYSSCNGNDWHIYGQDLIFKEYFTNGYGWNYDVSAPAANDYDFESVALHELGHAHVLGHVIEGGDVLHFALAAGNMRRVLTYENINAGNYVMDVSTTTNGCGVSPMTSDFPNGCSLTETTDVSVYSSTPPLSNQVCTGPTDIKISFKNFGNDTINEIDFNWSVNGAVQPQTTWSGTLLSQDTLNDFLIGNYNLQDSLYEIIIWADTVNGANELNQNNDTLTYHFQTDQCSPDNSAITGLGQINVDSCLSIEDITVDLYNDGVNDLTNCWVFFEANGILLDSLYWTGLITPGDTLQDLLVSTFSGFHPSAEIVVWTEMPNGNLDTYPANDTIETEIVPNQLLGSYTIGGTDPDFITIGDAFYALDSFGICGNVTLNIRDGNYDENLYLDSIPSSNPIYKVTVQSESLDPTQVILENGYISFSRVTNLDLKHLSLVNHDISIFRGCKNLLIDNNIFDDCGISITTNQDSLTCDSITISNSLFRNGFVLSEEIQYLNTFISDKLTIDNNEFYNSDGHTLNISGYQDIVISNNYLEEHNQSNSTIDYGMWIDYDLGNLIIHDNTMVKSTKGDGVRIMSDAPDSMKYVKIYNNSIYLDLTINNHLSSSFEIERVNKLDFFHNTTHIYNHDFNNIGNIYLREVDSALFKNNLIISEDSGYVYQLYHVDYIESDYNNYWSNGYFAKEHLSGSNWFTYNTLSDFSSILSTDTNSHFIPVTFSAPDFLYPINTYDIDNLGTPISSINLDIVDSIRHAATPDVGAYEFDQFKYDLDLRDTSSWIDTSFCSGESIDLILKAFNHGSEAIDSFNVYVSLENTPTDTVTIFQVIPPEQEITFNVGNFTFVNPATDYTISIGYPNGTTDSVPYNNALSGTFYTKLDGQYTVGDSTSDFTTIEDVITNLHEAGMCGAVIFNLKNGVYQNLGTIESIDGNSHMNSITFQSEVLDTSAVSIEYTPVIGALVLKDIDNLSFRHITFDGYPLSLDSVNVVKFDTCRFLHNQIGGSPNSSSSADSVSITSCHFENARIKFLLSNNISNFKIIQNSFSDQSNIEFNGTSGNYNNILIKDNTMNFDTWNVSFGANIELLNCSNIEVSNNIINTAIKAIMVNECVSGNNVIKNNFINTSKQAFSFGLVTQLKVLNNSLISSEIDIYGLNSMEFKNNIFQQITPSAGYFNFDYISQGDISAFNSENNLFYGGDTTLFANVNYNGGMDISYSDWKGVHDKDTSSYFSNPAFFSNTDLHSNSMVADSNGMVLPEVAYDIDGDLRNLTHPDIGADEFEVNWSAIFDLSADSLIHPNPANCYLDDSISFQFTNNYSDTLTSADITWSVNNNADSTINWSGTLLPGQSEIVLLESGSFTPGSVYDINVHISNPNGNFDAYQSNDTIHLIYQAYEDVVINANQNIVCSGAEILLEASVYDSLLNYLWSTGSTDSSISVDSGGTYWLETTNSFGCIEQDTITITQFPSPTPVSIDTMNTIFCEGDYATLSVDTIVPGHVHSWSWVGGNPTTINVDATAEVVLTTENQNGCLQYDTVQVTSLPTPFAGIYLDGSTLQSASTTGTQFQWFLDGVAIPNAIWPYHTPTVNGDYFLVVSDGTCSDTSSTITYNQVGLNEVDKHSVFLSPNPVSNLIQIHNLNETYHYKIYDATGRLVKEENHQTDGVISLTELSSGVYVINLYNDQLNISRRFIKK